MPRLGGQAIPLCTTDVSKSRRHLPRASRNTGGQKIRPTDAHAEPGRLRRGAAATRPGSKNDLARRCATRRRWRWRWRCSAGHGVEGPGRVPAPRASTNGSPAASKTPPPSKSPRSWDGLEWGVLAPFFLRERSWESRLRRVLGSWGWSWPEGLGDGLGRRVLGLYVRGSQSAMILWTTERNIGRHLQMYSACGIETTSYSMTGPYRPLFSICNSCQEEKVFLHMLDSPLTWPPVSAEVFHPLCCTQILGSPSFTPPGIDYCWERHQARL